MLENNDVRMSRARLYILIDSCEQDMRLMIERHILDHQEEEKALTASEFEMAHRRREADEADDQESIVHYLDIQATYDILLRGKNSLPLELANELTANASSFASLVPIRHRVMHGRPLRSEDPKNAVTLLSPFETRHWKQTRETVQRLRKDPTWEPLFEKRAAPYEKTLHNLPEADYDETSFIGRKLEKQKLIDALKRRRHSVITLTGEGGIGKTALALDVAYQLLDSSDNPYEAILWVSLKTEKLTAYGIEELKGAIRGIEGTIQALGKGIASDFRGSLEDLAEGLEDIETLIIIDNLESAQGHEIVDMYDALPTSVNYLFTSRWGVGQLERIFPLPPLSESEAILLLRKFATARGQSKLASLKDVTIKKVVAELRYSPLAVRWFVLASEAGNIPLQTIRDQRELLEFCVRNVVDNLSEDSKAVLSVLVALERPIGFDEFAILTEMSIDTLRRVTQELTRSSLVVVEAETAGAIAGRLSLTPTARSFLPRPDHNGAFIAKVLQRERQFKASLEATFGPSGSRLNLERVHPRDSGDHSAMYLLQTAQSLARSGQFSNAHGSIERAKSFNPEYSEVYRISGLVHAKENHNETAVSELKAALRYAVEPEVIAATAFSLADTISRRLHDANLALPYARMAYENFPCGDTAFLFGKLLIWVEDFKGGQEYLQEVLDVASGKHRVVVTTVLVDSWARWSSALYKNHEFDDAFRNAHAGFHIGLDLLADNKREGKLIDAMAECCITLLKSYCKLNSLENANQASIIRNVGSFVSESCTRVSSKKAYYLGDALSAAIGFVGAASSASAPLQDAYVAISSLERR